LYHDPPDEIVSFTADRLPGHAVHLRKPAGYSRDAYQRAQRRAGLPTISIHDVRHSFGSQLVQADVPLYTVQKLLGHKNIATTKRYAKLAPANLRDAVHRLHRRTPETPEFEVILGSKSPDLRHKLGHTGQKEGVTGS